MENSCSDNEEPEEYNLEKQSCQDNFLSSMQEAQCPHCLKPTAKHLRQERKHVTPNKQTRLPADWYEGESLAVSCADDPTQCHIDASGEEGGTE